MKLRSYIVYGIILALLAGYYGYFEVYRKEKNEKVAAEKKKIFHVDTSAVNGIKVLPKGKQEIDLSKKDDGTWAIIRPISSPGDKMEVEELLEYLNKVEKQSVVAEGKTDLTQFGLKDPSLTISFKEGDQWKELLFGDKNPVNSDYYATVGSGESVFIVSASNFRVVNKDLYALRDKTVFSVKSDGVEEIDLRKGSFRMTVKKAAGKDGAWQLENNGDFRVDKNKVEDVIRQFSWLRASSFVTEKDDNLAAYGLDSPQATVTLKEGEVNETLLIGSPLEKEKDKVYVKRGKKPEIMSIESRYLSMLPTSPAAIEDRAVFHFDVDAVHKMTFRMEDADYTLKREKGSWKWEAPENLKGGSLEGWTVESALWPIKSMEYNEKVNEAGQHFEKVVYTLSLLDEDGKSIAELSVGDLKEGTEDRYVKAVNKEGTLLYLVHRKSLDDIKTKLSQLKEKKK